MAVRRRARVIGGLRRAAAPVARPPGERCELCGLAISSDHRHLLELGQRRIVCACEGCWAMRAAEGDYRPVGTRVVWLSDLRISDELWARLQIPISLAFFMHSTVTGCVVAMYPSPAGATESELRFDSWAAISALDPLIADLEGDVEGLIADRISQPARYVIAPIDRCYELTGAIRLAWRGISGGPAVREAIDAFFERLGRQGGGGGRRP
ncbi:MAG TPA: DUF5947 family protein [Solirubrobacteraceae bacterium]|nr:DUF5947 family protein [Solirubrobacteraceae bacterium]